MRIKTKRLVFKTLGIELKTDQRLREELHAFMAQLVCLYRQESEAFSIEENVKRESYRVPIQANQPPGYDIEAWAFIEREERKIKLRIRDISAGGFSAILPFPDEEGVNKPGKILDILLYVNGKAHELEGTIKRSTRISPSKGQQMFLKRYYDQIHASDRGKDVRFPMSSYERRRIKQTS